MIAAAIGCVIAAIAFILLPSLDTTQHTSSQHSWNSLFTRSRLFLLIVCAAATFFDLFAFYGVTIWLTQLMREFNIPLENSLQLSCILNAGAVIGSLATSYISLRLNVKR